MLYVLLLVLALSWMVGVFFSGVLDIVGVLHMMVWLLFWLSLFGGGSYVGLFIVVESGYLVFAVLSFVGED